MAIIWLLILLLIPASAHAEIIHQDNFETSVSAPWECTDSAPTGWYSALDVISDCASTTYSSATHYSMEISPGTGHSGNGLLFYRYGTWPDDRLYAMLNEDHGGSYTDIYVGWYMKIPSALTASGLSYLKLWRGFTSSGSNTDFYLNINGDGDSLATSGRLQFIADGYNWLTLMNNTQLDAVRDDEWHYYQMRLKLNSNGSSDGIVQFWLDGVQHDVCLGDGSGCSQTRSYNFTAVTGTVFYRFSFGVGNNNGVTWQSTWQALSFDDLVLATTKAETDAGSSSAVLSKLTGGGKITGGVIR